MKVLKYKSITKEIQKQNFAVKNRRREWSMLKSESVDLTIVKQHLHLISKEIQKHNFAVNIRRKEWSMLEVEFAVLSSA